MCRWVLFPPGLPRETVKPKAYVRKGEDDEPIDYFTNCLPRIKAVHPELVPRIIEFVQVCWEGAASHVVHADGRGGWYLKLSWREGGREGCWGKGERVGV